MDDVLLASLAGCRVVALASGDSRGAAACGDGGWLVRDGDAAVYFGAGRRSAVGAMAGGRRARPGRAGTAR
jgi:hypothetical protein